MNVSLNKLLVFGWFGVMTVISGFLVAEYQFFRAQALQLEQLKDDYSQHIALLKKRMYHYNELPETGELKKKPATADTKEVKRLLLVNRACNYLKKSALSFARTYNMDHVLEGMYETSPSIATRVKKRVVNKHVRARRRKKQLVPVESQWRKLQREPIFKWPLERSNFWLSSPFGPRKNPDGTWGFHTGIDMAAPRGTPVKSAGDGLVVQAAYAAGYGNTIVIEHDHKFKTRYAHLDKIYVHIGQRIKQGEYIGKVGATGFVRKRKGGDASHLHFEVYVFGKHANPFHFLA